MRDTIYIDTYDQSQTTDIKKLLDADKSCQYTISRLYKAIEGLQSHRIELADQVKKVQALPFKNVLTIKRQKSYHENKIYYYIDIEKTYEGGLRSQSIFHECFTGTERKQAFLKFESLKKTYPGIETVINIEKPKWEK